MRRHSLTLMSQSLTKTTAQIWQWERRSKTMMTSQSSNDAAVRHWRRNSWTMPMSISWTETTALFDNDDVSGMMTTSPFDNGDTIKREWWRHGLAMKAPQFGNDGAAVWQWRSNSLTMMMILWQKRHHSFTMTQFDNEGATVCWLQRQGSTMLTHKVIMPTSKFYNMDTTLRTWRCLSKTMTKRQSDDDDATLWRC